MTKYERLKQALAKDDTGQMKAFGSSMTPILKSGSLLTFVADTEYRVGDIVFCKVKGRYIDAHKVTKVSADGRYLISNNKGHDNGWTSTIFGRVVKAEYDGEVKTFDR